MTGPRTGDRVVWRPHDLLAAGDLDLWGQAEAGRRVRHTRDVHRTWGVLAGLEVTRSAAREVTVAPGLAHTRGGRELWLEQPLAVPAPASAPAPGWVLTLRATSPPPDCAGAPPVRGAGVGWRAPSDVPPDEVPLAAVYDDGPGLADPDPTPRRSARGRPATARAGTHAISLDLASALVHRISIDTAAAGFVRLPVYLAALELDPAGLAGLRPATWRYLRGPFLEVVEPTTTTAVVVRVRFALRATAVGILDDVAPLPARVLWTGVEPPPTP